MHGTNPMNPAMFNSFLAAMAYNSYVNPATFGTPAPMSTFPAVSIMPGNYYPAAMVPSASAVSATGANSACLLPHELPGASAYRQRPSPAAASTQSFTNTNSAPLQNPHYPNPS
jgi:hypothetical protein